MNKIKNREDNFLKSLPHYYRIITEKVVKKPIFPAFLLFVLFIISFFLPQNQRFQKAKMAILKNKQNVDAHLILLDELINTNDFEGAKKELIFLENSYQRLNNQQKEKFKQATLQYNESTKEGCQKLVKNWQIFLQKNPDYKIGWLYLAYYQAKLGDKEIAKKSIEKAQSIDPGLSSHFEDF